MRFEVFFFFFFPLFFLLKLDKELGHNLLPYAFQGFPISRARLVALVHDVRAVRRHFAWKTWRWRTVCVYRRPIRELNTRKPVGRSSAYGFQRVAARRSSSLPIKAARRKVVRWKKKKKKEIGSFGARR